MTESIQKLVYLYKITNLVNSKVYIGQTIDGGKRWWQHKHEAAKDIPSMIINKAMKKHGINNFIFELIATCKNYDDANEIETLLVTQYDSHISKNKGYNVSNGGSNAPKTDEWKQAMVDWRNSLSEEEKGKIKRKQSEATFKQIEENGHPSLGKKRSPEQIEAMVQTRYDNPVEYTPEIRQRMSESHMGKIQSPELIAKRIESIKLTVAARQVEQMKTEEIFCHAIGCNVKGFKDENADKIKYKYYENLRYCNVHGQRLIKNGTLECKPPAGPKGIPSHNKIKFTEDQIQLILSDIRSNRKIAKDFKVTPKVIKRIKSGNY